MMRSSKSFSNCSPTRKEIWTVSGWEASGNTAEEDAVVGIAPVNRFGGAVDHKHRRRGEGGVLQIAKTRFMAILVGAQKVAGAEFR